jgi:hypothetical protein
MAGIVERLRDGFPTTITMTGAGVTFYEVTVQPPGIDGGEPINTTTMRNVDVRTFAGRHLYTLTPQEISVGYDPTAYDTIKAAVNVNQSMVTTFPDGATLTWWGLLQKFVPEAMEEGKMPIARITLVPTNVNASGVETVPVLVAGSGTGA